MPAYDTKEIIRMKYRYCTAKPKSPEACEIRALWGESPGISRTLYQVSEGKHDNYSTCPVISYLRRHFCIIHPLFTDVTDIQN